MEVVLLGVRGSCFVSSSPVYGGDTSCLRVRTAQGGVLYVDAGSGLRCDTPEDWPEGRCAVLLTHVHWDHVFGLPFFAPLYDSSRRVDIYTPEAEGNILDTLFDGVHFPVSAGSLSAQVRLIRYTPGDTLFIEGVRVRTVPLPHPGGNAGMRLEADGQVVALSGDCEICGDEPELDALLQGADLAVVDGHYSTETYPRFKGWGHSPREVWLHVARKQAIRTLLFSHHDPASTDAMLDAERVAIRQQAAQLGLDADLARQGLVWAAGSVLE